MSYGDFGSIALGRLTLREALSVASETGGSQGRQMKLTGQEAVPALTSAQLAQVQDDLTGMVGSMVPAAFTVKTDRDGYWIVTDVQADLMNYQGELVTCTWQLTLARVGSDTEVDLESRLSGSLARSNAYSATGVRVHCPPIGHYGYYTGPTQPSVLVRTGSDGAMLVYRGVPTDVNPRWGCSVSTYLAGRVRFLDAHDLERAGTAFSVRPLNPPLTPAEDLAPSSTLVPAAGTATRWTLHNTLVKVTPISSAGTQTSTTTTSTTSTLLYARGVNTSGGEFAASNTTLPGTYGTDYSYDTAGAFTALATRGHKIIRLPFRWERIQPTRGAALDATELARIQGVVANIAAAGMTCILDVHNYARYIPSGGSEQVLGDGNLTQAQLVDLWTRLSTAFKGNAGVYAYGLMNEPHDLPAVAATFTGTTRYDWNGGTVAGWTGDTATASNVGSKLRLSASVGTGSVNFRKDDAGTVTGGALTGTVIRFEATLVTDPGATGGWSAKAQWQNSSFAWQNPTSVSYTRVDTGAALTGLVSGLAVNVTCTFSSITEPPNAFAIQIDGHGATAGTVVVDIDNFAQGSLSGGLSGAQVWETASQACVTAIRGLGDTTKIMVPGYGFSGATSWTDNHPAPWINDPSPHLAYEAHYYFDGNNSGVYSSSYATENAAAVTAGYTSLSNRATTELGRFTTWCTSNNVEGFIGEIGWPIENTEQSFATIGATTSGQISAVSGAGLTHNVVVAFWDRLQPSGAGTALDATALADLNTTIAANTAAGLQSILEHALHYPPSWVVSAVEPFKDQAGNVWTGSSGNGDQVRNWMWTSLGRTYVADFLAKVYAGLTPTNRANVDRIRFGGGVFGELHYPTTAVASPYSYWAFGTSMQTGSGLASGLTAAPDAAYTPFTGTTTQDNNFIAWYLGGIHNWMTWYAAQLTSAGWTCDLMMLHPGYGIRSNQTHSDAGYRQALSCGEDPAGAIAAYASNPQVWPWCTWNDGPDGFSPATVDSDQAAWKKVFAEAYKWGKHTRIWGENTGGETNSQMDDVFANAMAQTTPAIGNPIYPAGVTPPSVYPGYVGMMWLNYADLTAGGSHATLAHYQAKVAATLSRWNTVGAACYDLLDTAQIDATYWAAGARWGTGYALSVYTGTNQDTVRSQAVVIESHPTVVRTATTTTTVDGVTVGGTLTVSSFTGGLWRDIDWSIQVGAKSLGVPDAVTVLRNEPEIVVVRALYSQAPGRVTVDLTLRRGHRCVEVYVQSGSSSTITIQRVDATPGAATGGYVVGSGNDGDGNRYVIGSASLVTADTVNGGISASAVTALDAFIGVQAGGNTALPGDLAEDLFSSYIGAASETVQAVRR